MNVIVVGVGGQGTVFTSKLIKQCALNSNLNVKTAEVFGMAQRGGSVISEIRFGQDIISPKIAEKEVDLIIGYEIMETARYINRLKPEGVVITNDSFIRPYTTKKEIIKEESIIEFILSRANNVKFVNASKIAQDLGNIRVINTIMIGICSTLSMFPFSEDVIKTAIEALLPKRLVDINIKALTAGIKCGTEL